MSILLPTHFLNCLLPNVEEKNTQKSNFTNTHIHLSLVHIDGNEKNTFNLIWNFLNKNFCIIENQSNIF